MANRMVVPEHRSIQWVLALTDIGNQVRAARSKAGLRIDTAAALCGVSVSLMSALESGGKRSVGLEKALHVLDCLGLAMVITTKEKAEAFARDAEHVERA